MDFDPLLDGLGPIWAAIIIITLALLPFLLLGEGLVLAFRGIRDGPERRKREHRDVLRTLMRDWGEFDE